MDFLSLGERKVATARLLCDVSRTQAASLTEPLLAGLLAKARTLPRFISEKALTNQQPELAEDSASRMLGHRSTPLLQRCCDDSLNRSIPKVAFDDGNALVINFHPSSPERTLLDPYRKPLAELSHLSLESVSHRKGSVI